MLMTFNVQWHLVVTLLLLLLLLSIVWVKQLKQLKSKVAQIALVTLDIRTRLEQIETFSLLKLDRTMEQVVEKSKIILKVSATLEVMGQNELPDVNRPPSKERGVTFSQSHTHPIREFFRAIANNKNDKIKKIQKLFESTGPLLIKLESLILGTYTGESPKMKLYYAAWEKQMFEILIRFDDLTSANSDQFVD